MSITHINRGDAGVAVEESDLSGVRVSVSAYTTHILPFAGSLRIYMDIDSGDMLDNLIEALIEARTLVTVLANKRWDKEVEADADSELIGNPKEEAA